MKRATIVLLFLHAAVFALLAQTPTAYIREMIGTVELKLPGTADWVPAKVGDRIGEAAVISTGFKSSAVLSVGNSTLTVRALTRVSLETLMSQNETETIGIGLSTGRVRAEVNPPAGGRTNFSVQTPSAVAAVKGTVFEMNTIEIFVHEGSISFEPSGDLALRPVMVNSGQGSWVDAEIGAAINPFAAADAYFTLPSLPGQSPTLVLDMVKQEPQSGSLLLDLELLSQ